MPDHSATHDAEGDGNKGKGKEEKPEPEANFALSGKLAAESNTVNGVVLVHQEPPESRKPAQMWRLYGFKNSNLLLPFGINCIDNLSGSAHHVDADVAIALQCLLSPVLYAEHVGHKHNISQEFGSSKYLQLVVL